MDMFLQRNLPQESKEGLDLGRLMIKEQAPHILKDSTKNMFEEIRNKTNILLKKISNKFSQEDQGRLINMMSHHIINS